MSTKTDEEITNLPPAIVDGSSSDAALALANALRRCAPVAARGTDMDHQLKPCPFCGGVAMFTVERRKNHPDIGGHSAMCGTCGAGIGYVFATGDDPRPLLAEQWNKRTTGAKHGIDCRKAPHVGEGYLHASDDDGPYDVDGLAYCGRCHVALACHAHRSPPLSRGAEDVMAERARQVEQKGRPPEHDDAHESGQLAAAGSAYALAAADHLHPFSCGDGGYDTHATPLAWPQDWEFKPGPPRRMLVKAAALIIAEIERLDRSHRRHHDS